MGLRKLESRLTQSNAGHMSRLGDEFNTEMVSWQYYVMTPRVYLILDWKKSTPSCAWSRKFLVCSRRATMVRKKMARAANERLTGGWSTPETN